MQFISTHSDAPVCLTSFWTRVLFFCVPFVLRPIDIVRRFLWLPYGSAAIFDFVQRSVRCLHRHTDTHAHTVERTRTNVHDRMYRFECERNVRLIGEYHMIHSIIRVFTKTTVVVGIDIIYASGGNFSRWRFFFFLCCSQSISINAISWNAIHSMIHTEAGFLQRYNQININVYFG